MWHAHGGIVFDPDGGEVYFTGGMDDCVRFIHYTASLKCRVEIVERIARTLVSDARFCTPNVHPADKSLHYQHLYVYYDLDAVRV